MNKEILHLRNVLPLNNESQNTSLRITLQKKKKKKSCLKCVTFVLLFILFVCSGLVKSHKYFRLKPQSVFYI